MMMIQNCHVEFPDVLDTVPGRNRPGLPHRWSSFTINRLERALAPRIAQQILARVLSKKGGVLSFNLLTLTWVLSIFDPGVE